MFKSMNDIFSFQLSHVLKHTIIAFIVVCYGAVMQHHFVVFFSRHLNLELPQIVLDSEHL